MNGAIIVSDELPNYPQRTEKLHSFNEEGILQLLLKEKQIICLHETGNARLGSREETLIMREMKHCSY